MRAKRNSGFSLIEALAIAGILAVLVAVAAPTFDRTMEWYRLQSSANLIAAEMEAARVLAISRGATYELRFSGDRVQVIDVEDQSNPPRMAKVIENGVRIGGEVPSTASPLRFFPRGYVSNTFRIRVSNDQGAMQVEILRSGKVTVASCTSSQGDTSGTTTSQPSRTTSQ